MKEISPTNIQLPNATVVLANGDYPTHPLPLKILQDALKVVCCDGAANEYIRRGGLPSVVIGDGDSLLSEYRHLLMQVTEQDDNDLTKAVRYLMSQGCENIHIVGATGRREDHTLGNISLLMKYFRTGAKVRMFTDYGVFVPCRDETVFDCTLGKQVSIFNFEAANLHAEGLLYPLYDFTDWWQGTLNEATSTSISFHAKGDYMVFLNY